MGDLTEEELEQKLTQFKAKSNQAQPKMGGDSAEYVEAHQRKNSKSKNRKVHQRKKLPCTYCRELQFHLPRHIEAKHKDEEIVAMHMCCIGVMKKLLGIWTTNMKTILSKGNWSKIPNKLVQAAEYTPREHQRKPESLEELCNWKATQMRLFLLYVHEL